MKIKGIKPTTLMRLFGFLRPKTTQYFVTMGLSAVILAFERLFTGFIVKWFVDAITTGNMQLLWNTVKYWGLFALLLVFLTPVFGYFWRASVIHAVANIRQTLFVHLQRLPMGFHESRHSGESMSLLTNDIASAERAYQETIFNLVRSLIQGVGAVVIMLYLKWDLALIIIIGGTIPMLINVFYAKPLRTVGEETQAQLASVSERLADLLGGFQVTRIFNLGDWILERYMRSNQGVLDASLKRVRLESTLAAANNLGGVIFFLQILIGSYMVLDGQTTLGVLFGLTQLNNPVRILFSTIGSTISGIQGSLAATDRILAVLDTTPEPDRYPPAVEEFQVDSSAETLVEFDSVVFSYEVDERKVLDLLSFKVSSGQVAAFVGPSGGGKSTIFRLLMGFYPVQTGQVFIHGQPLHTFSLSELRRLFSYVPQDAFLYYGTIMENIRYGRPEANDDEVFTAARASYAHEFILELPNGYQTVVGERGARLSGGQRQRIAIARALIKNAPILLLDEATSALDSESELLVQQALNALMKDRTTIAIAHRLSTVENADLIYVIDKGQVVEQGKHKELINSGGLYNHLYQLQFEMTQPQMVDLPGMD